MEEENIDKPEQKVEITIPKKNKSPIISTVKPESSPSIYPTEYYKLSNINVCSLCGEKRRTNEYQQVFCPSKKTDCPMVLCH